MRLIKWFLFFLLLGASAITVAQKGPGRLRVSPSDQLIAPSTTLQYTATHSFFKGIGKPGGEGVITNAVTWFSSNPSVAMIGLHTGLATSGSTAGTAIITAASGPFKTSVLLTVSTATLSSITVTPTNPSVPLGRLVQFKATGNYSDGTQHDLTDAVTWSSGTPTVATISSLGLASTKTQGSSVISATFGSTTGNSTLTVTAPVLDFIQVTPSNAKVVLPATQQFTAIGVLSDGSTQNLTTSATWSSSNQSAATIGANTGLATAVGVGATTISATSSGVTGSTSFTVIALASIAISPSNPNVVFGSTLQLAAIGTYSDGSVQDLTATAAWSSTNTGVATVNASGLATSVHEGTTTIKATQNGVTGSTLLSVIDNVSISISPSSTSVAVNGTQQFTATVTGASNTSVTWSVNGVAGGNGTVGTVNASGLYTAPASVPNPSTVTVTATSVAQPSKFINASVTITPPPIVLVITSGVPLSPNTGVLYSFTFTAAGGTPPYKWTGTIISPDGASDGLTLNSSTGVLTGTPSYSGLLPLAISVQDANFYTFSEQYDLMIGGPGSPLAITNSPPGGTQGSAYAFRFATTWSNQLGCSPNMTYVEGSLPPGLTLNTLSGDLGQPPAASGTPTTAGTYTFTLFASAGSTLCAPQPLLTNSQTFTVQIAPAVSPSSPPGASNWVRSGSNPVLKPSSFGWDSFRVRAPSVVKLSGVFYMYYEAEDPGSHKRQIGLATSLDGVNWTKSGANPVVPLGPAGTWDSGEIRDPAVLFDGSQFRMWYSGWDGNIFDTQGIGMATSSDGVHWTKSASNPVLGIAPGYTSFFPGTVILNGGTFTMWYSLQGGTNIGRATSTDGINWTDQGQITEPTPFSGSRPAVVLDNGTYRMWFTQFLSVGSGLGNPNSVAYGNVAYATSPDGITWNVYNQNSLSTCFFCVKTENMIPVLATGQLGAWDRPGVGDVSVIKEGAVFKMWYTGGEIIFDNYGGPDSVGFPEGEIGYATAQ